MSEHTIRICNACGERLTQPKQYVRYDEPEVIGTEAMGYSINGLSDDIALHFEVKLQTEVDLCNACFLGNVTQAMKECFVDC